MSDSKIVFINEEPNKITSDSGPNFNLSPYEKRIMKQDLDAVIPVVSVVPGKKEKIGLIANGSMTVFFKRNPERFMTHINNESLAFIDGGAFQRLLKNGTIIKAKAESSWTTPTYLICDKRILERASVFVMINDCTPNISDNDIATLVRTDEFKDSKAKDILRIARERRNTEDHLPGGRIFYINVEAVYSSYPWLANKLIVSISKNRGGEGSENRSGLIQIFDSITNTLSQKALYLTQKKEQSNALCCSISGEDVPKIVADTITTCSSKEFINIIGINDHEMIESSLKDAIARYSSIQI